MFTVTMQPPGGANQTEPAAALSSDKARRLPNGSAPGDGVIEALREAMREGDDDTEAVIDTLAARDALGETEELATRDADLETDAVTVAVLTGDAPVDGEIDDDAVRDKLTDDDTDAPTREALADLDADARDGETDAVRVRVALRVALSVRERVADGSARHEKRVTLPSAPGDETAPRRREKSLPGDSAAPKLALMKDEPPPPPQAVWTLL